MVHHVGSVTADGGRDADSFVVVCLEQLGSYAFVDFATSQNLVKDVQAATEDGLGPHAVILVAVNEKPFQQAAEVSSPHPYPPTDHSCTQLTYTSAVRSSSRNCHLHRSAGGGISARTRVRVCHQDDYDPRLLCR